MKVGYCLLLLLFSIKLCSERNIEVIPRPGRQLPLFIINLDDEPSVRFNLVLKYFKEKGHQVINEVFEKNIANKYLIRFLLYFRKEDPEILEEMKAAARILNVDLFKIQSIYISNELNYLNTGHPVDETGCTSIVGVDHATRQPILARNLDFGPVSLADIQYSAVFFKGGRKLFKTSMFAGPPFIHQGLRDKAYAVTTNSRHRTNFGQLVQVLWNIVSSVPSDGTILRKTLINAETYDTAVEMLSSEKMISGTFFTLAGVKDGEGVILGRSASNLDHTEKLENKNFIVQTNYDSWINNPFQQNDPRRKAAIKYLTDKDISEDVLHDTIASKGVIVSETLLECILNPLNLDYRCWAK